MVGDDQLLDLLGIFEDVDDFGISGQFFQQIVFGVVQFVVQCYVLECYFVVYVFGFGFVYGGFFGIGLVVVCYLGCFVGY